MAKWSQQVVTTLGFERSCVDLAFSLLDRYLSVTAQNSVLVDQGDYQLYSITLLYTSIKLVDSRKKLGVNDMIRICGGVHTRKDIQAAELHILETLNWQVSPPLVISFAEYLMELVPISVIQKERLRQKSLDVIDVAVADSHLVARKTSTIAIAAIVVAMMDVDGFTDVTHSAAIERFLDDVESMTRIAAKGEESFETISRLETMYFSPDVVVPC